MMRTLLHLKPDQKGTKQLLMQYGDRLVCVRYRYDAQRKKRSKTVECIVVEREWDPPAPRFVPRGAGPVDRHYDPQHCRPTFVLHVAARERPHQPEVAPVEPQAPH